MIYTTPWDNFLVANKVWWYGTDRILGTIAYVPVDKSKVSLKKPILKAGLIIALFVIEFFSILMIKVDSSFYMGLILSWSIPIVLIQTIAGFGYIAAHFKTFFMAFMLPSLYLCLADAYAIYNGIWDISKNFTLGIKFGPLPLEEVVFFFHDQHNGGTRFTSFLIHERGPKDLERNLPSQHQTKTRTNRKVKTIHSNNSKRVSELFSLLMLGRVFTKCVDKQKCLLNRAVGGYRKKGL